MTRLLLALLLAAVPLAAMPACGHTDRANAAATKPTGPANGAADYQYAPGGPHTAPTPPTVGTEPGATTAEPAPSSDCPPSCSPDGSWIGCGLSKPRGSGCKGCTPKCKGKGTADEGWYDCNGVMIAQRKCG